MSKKRYDSTVENIKKDFVKGKECFTINRTLIISEHIKDEISLKSANKFITDMNSNLKEN